MTRLVRFSNNAVSRLAANITNASTTISLTPGDGAKFPVISGTQFFMATLIKSTGETEIVKVTARATDTLTVVRAAEPVGATQVAYAFSAGDRIEQRLTAKALSDELDRLDSGANIGATSKAANYTVQAADVSTLIRVDTTAGAITITLPEIASLADDFDIMVAKVTDNANAVNIVRAGSTDLINGATSYPVNNQWQSAWLIADRSTNTWTAINSGAATSSIAVDTFTGDGTAGPYTLSGDPMSKANTAVYLSGVYQQKATYTLSGTSLTMGGNVPVGVTVEVVWSRPLSIGRTDAELVSYDGGTVQDVLDGAKSLQDYAALRAYTGRASRVYITGLLGTAKPAGIAGVFQYDQGDTTSADNGGTIIVDALNRRWRRDYSGDVNIKWFGAKTTAESPGFDSTSAIMSALNAVYATGGGVLESPAGEFLVDTISKTFASGISVTFKGAGKMATVWRKIGSSTTPILDLFCTTAPGVTYSPIKDMRFQGNAKTHDGIMLTNWARFSLENVYVSGCNVGINNRGSLVFIAKDCTVVSNNTGYKSDAFNGVGANLYNFIGGSISANTVLGVDLGNGEGFAFDGTDFGGNGTAGDMNTGAVLIRSSADDAIGVSFGSFGDCWFESNKGVTIKAEASELHLSFRDTQCLTAEGGNVMNVGDIRSLQLMNFIAPSSTDTVTVAAKNFTSIGGIIANIVDNSTVTSNVFGTATATAGVGTRAKQFNPQIGNSSSYGISPGVVFKNGTSIGNTGSTETDLRSYTLPANAFSANGKGVRITAYGTSANNVNAKTVRVYFDGVVIGSITLTPSQANTFRIDGEVLYDSGTNSRAIIQAIQGGTTPQTNCVSTTITAYIPSNQAIIKVTGQGVSDSDIVLRGIVIEYIA